MVVEDNKSYLNTLNLGEKTRFQILVPIGDITRITLSTVNFAKALGDKVTVVHVSDDLEAIEKLKTKWEATNVSVPLVILESQYRSILTPLLTYLDSIHQRDSDEVVIVVLPEFVAKHWWENVLHNQTAFRLKAALLYRPGMLVLNVPYQLR
jgi:hypothetical protein